MSGQRSESLHSLPLFVRLEGRPVILLGAGSAADAKRRLLERAGAVIVGEDAEAALAIVAQDAPEEAVARLRARGVLVNAVDRPELCDFTLPAIVDRDPVLVAIGTGGVSAGLAAALRQRLEALLPMGLGALAEALFAARSRLREVFPESGARRRAIADALAPRGILDPFGPDPDVTSWLMDDFGPTPATDAGCEILRLTLTSPDPDDLTLRQARALANADRVTHRADVPRAILDRARADADRVQTDAPPTDDAPGLTVDVAMVGRLHQTPSPRP